MLTPPGYPPPPNTIADTAHSAHSQHCGHTTQPLRGWKTNPCRHTFIYVYNAPPPPSPPPPPPLWGYVRPSFLCPCLGWRGGGGGGGGGGGEGGGGARETGPTKTKITTGPGYRHSQLQVISNRWDNMCSVVM